MQIVKSFLVLLLASALFAGCGRQVSFSSADGEKPRVMVLTDAEIDDQCSMVRFLLSANEYEVEGIITTSSQFHWEDHHWAGDDWLDPFLSAYREVYPNLIKHDASYPAPDYIESVSLLGNVDMESEMEKVTPGSEHIVKVLLDESDSRPIWFQAWGGTNTLARALKTIEEEHPEKMDYVASKLRLYLIWEQDNTYQEYIHPVWGKYNIPTILSDQFWAIAYSWRDLLPSDKQVYFEPEWIKSHILEGHGALCDIYRARDGRFPSEGDSPSFIYNIRTGLNNMDHPEWGSWGGRYTWVRENTYADPAPVDDPSWKLPEGRYNPMTAWLGQHRDSPKEIVLKYYSPISHWVDAFQNDFAARADWCVKSYEDANHAPVAVVAGEQMRTAKTGETLTLDASRSTDPDGDQLSFSWWFYEQAGSFRGAVSIDKADAAKASVTIPADAKSGDTLHLVCSVKDTGSPQLTRYARVVVTIE